MTALDAKRGAGPARENKPDEPGFDGQLRYASLADLIQLQCGNRAHIAVSVHSLGRDGHLFFDEGQIVHARAEGLEGEDAVFEMLSWTTGSFRESPEEWPREPSVHGTWQQLLLTAAQRKDEESAGIPAASTARFVAVKRPEGVPSLRKSLEGQSAVPRPLRSSADKGDAQRPSAEATKVNGADMRKVSAAPRPAEGAWSALVALASVSCAARLDALGQTLQTHGDAAALASLGTFVRKLADTLGDNLGQVGFRCFEARAADHCVVLFVDTPATYVVAKVTSLDEVRPLYRAPAGG